MTMVEALGRVAEIQSTLVKLAPPQVKAADAAAEFAKALTASVGASQTAGATPVANPIATGTATGADVVASAEKYLGVPYVFGGEDASGMDCSGLVQRVYSDLGIDVPRLVSGQMTLGTEVPSLAQAKPGDLIVTGGGEHILIYAGNNKVIHAPYEGRTVSLVDAYMTDADIDTIRRVIPDAGPASAVSGLGPTATAGASADTDLIAAALAALARGGNK